jgi:hypothetical protein
LVGLSHWRQAGGYRTGRGGDREAWADAIIERMAMASSGDGGNDHPITHFWVAANRLRTNGAKTKWGQQWDHFDTAENQMKTVN